MSTQTIEGAHVLKVMIFGGLGFVGSHLSDLLAQEDCSLVLVTRNMSKTSNIAHLKNRLDLELADVTDFDLVQHLILKHQPDVIFHLAGQLTSYESFEKPLYDVDVNSKSTIAMLEALRKLKRPSRFILGSTFWVVGRPTSLPVSESTPCYPRNVYAADRLASEHYCSIYHHVYDLDTVVMRFTNVFGPREQKDNARKAALNHLIYKGFKGEPITIYGKGDFYRDIIYVSDVVSAAHTIMEKGEAGQTYFVGTSTPTWFHQIGEWISEYTGAPIKYVDPPDYHRRVDVGNFLVDNTKLRSLVWNWKIPVKEGIKKTLDYYATTEGSGGA